MENGPFKAQSSATETQLGTTANLRSESAWCPVPLCGTGHRTVTVAGCARVGPDEKAEKKKVAFPRRTWQINPVTRGKESSKRHSHLRAGSGLRKEFE